MVVVRNALDTTCSPATIPHVPRKRQRNGKYSVLLSDISKSLGPYQTRGQKIRTYSVTIGSFTTSFHALRSLFSPPPFPYPMRHPSSRIFHPDRPLRSSISSPVSFLFSSVSFLALVLRDHEL